jgi:hypothetical protein
MPTTDTDPRANAIERQLSDGAKQFLSEHLSEVRNKIIEAAHRNSGTGDDPIGPI